MRVGALAWMRVFTVSRGCTATAEALIAAAPAAAWPANTLSPSGLPPPTIAAAWKAGAHPPGPGNGEKRRRGGLGEGGEEEWPRCLNGGPFTESSPPHSWAEWQPGQWATELGPVPRIARIIERSDGQDTPTRVQLGSNFSSAVGGAAGSTWPTFQPAPVTLAAIAG